MFEVKIYVECPALEKLAAAISSQNKSVGMPAWCDAVVTDAPEHPTANTAPAAAPDPMQPAAPMPGAGPTAASAPAAPPVMPPVAEIITRPAVVTITPDEVIVGEVDKVITYTCPDGYIPFSISTSNRNAIVEIISVELISPIQGRWKLTYHMTWAGDTMEEVDSTISLIKV